MPLAGQRANVMRASKAGRAGLSVGAAADVALLLDQRCVFADPLGV